MSDLGVAERFVNQRKIARAGRLLQKTVGAAERLRVLQNSVAGVIGSAINLLRFRVRFARRRTGGLTVPSRRPHHHRAERRENECCDKHRQPWRADKEQHIQAAREAGVAKRGRARDPPGGAQPRGENDDA